VEEHSRIIKQGLATILLLGNYGAYEFNGDYFSPNPNPFTHTWSLSLEEQIYFILPILLIVLTKIKFNQDLKVQYYILSIISFLFFIIPSLTISFLNIFSINDYFGNFSYYSTIHRFWEFGAGGILRLSSWNFRKYPKSLNFFLNIALLVLLVKGFSDSILNTILVVLITCLAISSKSLNLMPKFLKKGLVKVGGASYSLYLVHLPIVYIVKYSLIFQINNDILESSIMYIFIGFFGFLLNTKVENKFRYSFIKDNLNYLTLKRAVLYFLILPFILLSVLLQVSNVNYFNFISQSNRPLAAWEVDKECVQDQFENPCISSYPYQNGTILLIGDSHATHLSRVIRQIAFHKNFQFALWDRCDFQITDSGNNQDPTCIKHNIKVLNWVKSMKPEIVIVSQRMHESTSEFDVEIALNELIKISPKVLLVGNNPVFGDSTKFFTQTLIFEYEPAKRVKIKDMDRDSLLAADKFKKLANKLGIIYLDTRKIFCGEVYCKRFENGKWLFWDAGHLSIYGADLLAEPLYKLMF
jgi:hypothetical protein